MRKSLAVAVAALTVAGVGALVPTAANAATSGNTTVTFALQPGALSIVAPANASLGNVAASTTATTATGTLGSTTVTDTRGALLGTYTVTVTSSNFTTGAGTTLGTDQISGATVTAMSGTVTFTNAGTAPLQTTTPVAANGVLPIAANVGFTGNSTATYNPTITVPIPATNVAGTYTGTITQTAT